MTVMPYDTPRDSGCSPLRLRSRSGEAIQTHSHSQALFRFKRVGHLPLWVSLANGRRLVSPSIL
ncbi:unnamed protein product [Gulo gulo]|uniref:Uncharacterized protein n=1 Tax=Gulo gulo TaxID=48420 RepID=A0A9X9Q9R8_GULGU|nr:unnamed protein product [Gulo gulo]